MGNFVLKSLDSRKYILYFATFISCFSPGIKPVHIYPPVPDRSDRLQTGRGRPTRSHRKLADWFLVKWCGKVGRLSSEMDFLQPNFGTMQSNMMSLLSTTSEKSRVFYWTNHIDKMKGIIKSNSLSEMEWRHLSGVAFDFDKSQVCVGWKYIYLRMNA